MDALILSCGTGGGHNAAGRALKEALERRGHRVEMFNPYELVSDRLAGEVDRLYIQMAQKMPRTFGFVYKLGNLYRKLPVKSPVYHINRKMVPVMEKYLKEHHTDVIFMPHLYPAEIMTQMKKRGISVPLTIFVATDYVCIPFTEETDCDYYIVPGEDLLGDFERRGLKKEKLMPFGIPTSSAFSSSRTCKEAREATDLKPEKHYVLISGGSIGAGQLRKVVRILYRHYCGTKTCLIVICGNNETLYEKLSREYAAKKDEVSIYKSTDHMADYMRACDVVITKPGGLSSTEAAVLGTSLIHITPIPGCETLNMEYFAGRGMSVPVEVPDARLGRLCDRMMEPEYRRKMADKQKQYIHADAADRICDFSENCFNYMQNSVK